MRFSVAATVIASTNSLVLVAPSEENPPSIGLAANVQEEISSGSIENDQSPYIRPQRAHWTLPRTPAEDVKSLPDPLASKSAVLTNREEVEDKGINNAEYQENSKDKFDAEDQDLGILSAGRLLSPVNGKSSDSPNSTVFDSFTVFDRDRTEFYSICDPTVEDEYFCTRCDTNSTEKTVADFECQKVSCYEVDSRCPNNKMVICRYDTLSRLFDYEPTGNTSAPYTSEKCRKIEARLSKTDRALLPFEESSWDFTYCLRYNVASLPEEGEDKANTCEMEIDGTVCNKCLLETVDFSLADNASAQKQFCVDFDCGNTLLGYEGRFCNEAGLASSSIDYFIYRSLPCDGGCNLCGDSDDPALMRMMSFPESFFDSTINSSNAKYLNSLVLPDTLNCFETQWGALTTTSGFVCTELRDVVEEACGCISVGIPTPEEPAENITASDGGEEESKESSGTMFESNTGALLTSLGAAWIIGFGVL